MKVTVVPAQITTIEDRIAGSLGLSQILLLTAPIFIGTLLYAMLPPFVHSSPYKLVVIVTLFFVCAMLAIRIKGKILLLWLVTILRYKLRPHYYIYDKNSLGSRDQSKPEPVVVVTSEDKIPVRQSSSKPLKNSELTRVQALMDNPAAHVSFKATKKGGLYVLITEVEE